MKVNITCTGADLLPLDQILEFQGELKNLSDDNYQKLRKQMLAEGFSAPFFVWRQGQKKYILDGHQRKKALLDMKKEGIELPEKFPVVWIDAKDRKEAKRKVLGMASQYGEVTAQGLYDFIDEAGLTFDETSQSFRFPEIEFEDFKATFYDEKVQRDANGSQEIGEELFEGVDAVCPRCNFHFDANAQAKNGKNRSGKKASKSAEDDGDSDFEEQE
jgi:hypothetical protein